MARIRTVKPEFFTHEALHDAEKATGLPLRLAFVGLFTVADREGRFKWRPRAVKLDVMPYDDGVDFEQVLLALCEHGFLMRYEVDGEFYACIPSFSKHQQINSRESQSALPSPNLDERTFEQAHAHALHMTEQARTHGEGKGREGKGKGREKEKEGKENTVDAERVFRHWQTVMDSPRSAFDDKRAALIAKALALGYTAPELCKAIDGCKASAFHMGDNDRSTKFNGIELILRDASKIDGFIAMADTPPQRAAPPRETLNEQRARAFAELTGRSKPGAADDPLTVDGYAKRID